MSNVLPHGWKVSALSDLSKVITKGTTPTTNGFPYTKSGVNFLRVENISKGGKILESDLKYISEEAHKALSRSQLIVGDLLISIAGAIGRSAIVEKRHLPANTNQAVGIVRLLKDAVVNNYIRYAFESPIVDKQINNLQSGLAQINLNLEQLGSLRINLPPLPEQQKIAAILTAIDDVIESTQAQINKLKDLKTGMMQELLTKGIGHTDFKDSPVGRIPKAWQVVKLGSVLEKIDSGWSPNCVEIPPNIGEWGVLKVSAVTRDVFLEEQSKTLRRELEPRESIRVKVNDILLTRANGVAELVGKCVIVKDEPKRKLMMSDKLLRLNPNQKIHRNFLLHIFNSNVIRKQVEFCWGGSSGQKNIGQADIKLFSMPLPSLDEQASIGNSISEIENFIGHKNRKLEQLVLTKKALMQDLLTGKVRVKVNPQ